MEKCKPQDGGCWYCHTDYEVLHFSFEFDTYVHLNCIINRKFEMIKKKEHDPENEIFLKEFGLE
jgi:hypothetical protein